MGFRVLGSGFGFLYRGIPGVTVKRKPRPLNPQPGTLTPKPCLIREPMKRYVIGAFGFRVSGRRVLGLWGLRV